MSVCSRAIRFASPLLVLCLLIAPPSLVRSSDAAAVYGGPEFDPATGDGYTANFIPSRNAADGLGAGTVQEWVNHDQVANRAVRWDDSGWTLLADLSVPAGHASSRIYDVNADGRAVGQSLKSDIGGNPLGFRAVRWGSGSASVVELDHLGTDSDGATAARALAVNASGAAAGYAEQYDADGTFRGIRAVRWDAEATAAEALDHLGVNSRGEGQCYGYAINRRGDVAGYGYAPDGHGGFAGTRAVRWEVGTTTATQLDALSTRYGYTESRAFDINDAGVAVGFAYVYVNDVNKGVRAVRWEAGSTAATELDDLGLDATGETSCYARDINETGDAVGYGDKYVNGVDKGLRAIRWDAGSQTAIELDVLGHDAQGGSYAAAHRINDRGLAIGVANEYNGAGQYIGRRAVFWEPDGTVMKLDDLLEPGTGWLTLSEVRSINDENWVTGIGLYDPDGPGPLDPYDRPFLLQIPEPISLLMVVCGASMVFARGRRDR